MLAGGGVEYLEELAGGLSVIERLYLAAAPLPDRVVRLRGFYIHDVVLNRQVLDI